MKKIKQLWIKICIAAIGINLGLLIYSLLFSKYDLIPLHILNCLLLSTVFLIPNQQDD